MPVIDIPSPLDELVDATGAVPVIHSEARGVGRPRKRTVGYYFQLLAADHRAKALFAQRFGREARSDPERLTALSRECFLARGERAGNADSPAFKRRLKTLLNSLSEARSILRAISAASVFPGEEGS